MEPGGIALVTGASRGIGRAVAIDLARAGFDVVATMRDPSMGVDLVDEVEGGRGTVRVAALDVLEPDTIDIPDDLRVLVNNAGIERDYLPVEHTPMTQWREVFDTNLFGLLHVTTRAIPALKRSGGVVCTITSSSILVPVPFYAVYRASKAAVEAMSETLREELSPFGVRVIDVLPGPVESDMLAHANRPREAATYQDYAASATEQWTLQRGIAGVPAADAATEIRRAILADEGPLKWSCDPLGSSLIDAWRRRPEDPIAAFGADDDT